MALVGETRLADDQFDRIVAKLAALVEVSQQTQLPGKQLRQIVAALLTVSGHDPDVAVERYRKILARMEH